MPDYFVTDSSDFLECLLVKNIQSQQILQHIKTHKTTTCRFHTFFNKETEFEGPDATNLHERISQLSLLSRLKSCQQGPTSANSRDSAETMSSTTKYMNFSLPLDRA